MLPYAGPRGYDRPFGPILQPLGEPAKVKPIHLGPGMCLQFGQGIAFAEHELAVVFLRAHSRAHDLGSPSPVVFLDPSGQRPLLRDRPRVDGIGDPAQVDDVDMQTAQQSFVRGSIEVVAQPGQRNRIGTKVQRYAVWLI
jgi:hypothetical protein